MRILLVDDDPVYRHLLSELLAVYAHTVIPAGDGAQALELLGEHEIDIVLADALMPKMNGFEFHASLRANARWKRIPFVWISNHSDVLDAFYVVDHEVDFKLEKVRPVSELLHIINRLEARQRLATSEDAVSGAS